VITDEDLGERARELLEHYSVWFTEIRGAKLRLLRNALEFQEACDLCALWDDDRLEKLAKIVLTTDDGYISGTDRGWKIFARKATWADERLATWERSRWVSDVSALPGQRLDPRGLREWGPVRLGDL
jgi:hypothetical protein